MVSSRPVLSVYIASDCPPERREQTDRALVRVLLAGMTVELIAGSAVVSRSIFTPTNMPKDSINLGQSVLFPSPRVFSTSDVVGRLVW